LGNESVYNSGFALTQYLSQKYGEAKLREVTKALGKLKNFTVDAAFEDVLGKDGDEIYNEWKTFVTNEYKTERKRFPKILLPVRLSIHSASEISMQPFQVTERKSITFQINHPIISALHQFMSTNLETKKKKEITSGIRSTFNFIPGTNKIIYAKLQKIIRIGTTFMIFIFMMLLLKMKND